MLGVHVAVQLTKQASPSKQAKYTELCNQAGLKLLLYQLLCLESFGKVHLLRAAFFSTAVDTMSRATSREYHPVALLYWSS